jgi:hypothetical protein
VWLDLSQAAFWLFSLTIFVLPLCTLTGASWLLSVDYSLVRLGLFKVYYLLLFLCELHNRPWARVTERASLGGSEAALPHILLSLFAFTGFSALERWGRRQLFFRLARPGNALFLAVLLLGSFWVMRTRADFSP